jgi:tetratricopeptide (TPR) repeat protein
MMPEARGEAVSVPKFDFAYIAKHWHSRSGFLAVVIPLLGAEVAGAFALSMPLVLVGALPLTAAAVWLVWWRSRALPKTVKGKVGFVVCLSCDNEDQASRIRSDFIRTLHGLIQSGRTGRTFQFIEVPQWRAEKVVSEDDFLRLRVDTRALFVLCGRVRVGNVAGKRHDFIELNGVVGHSPISEAIGKKLKEEFGELLPRKVMISTDDDLLAFEFTSQWAELVARYVIGIAATVSGDFDYAENLFRDALDRVPVRREGDFPVFAKLRERLPRRIAELYEGRAVIAYERWVVTHDPAEIEYLGANLSQINLDQYCTVQALNLSAIHAFLARNDVGGSLAFLERVDGAWRDSAWHLNVAFLVAFQGDLKTALRHYRKAAEQRLHPDLLAKIEDFVYYIATTRADKYQLYYCLGFFNWKIKGDMLLAARYFQRFLKLRKDGAFGKEAVLAKKWLPYLN